MDHMDCPPEPRDGLLRGSPTQKANGARIHSGFIPGHVGEERGHDLLAVQVEHLIADRQVEHRPRPPSTMSTILTRSDTLTAMRLDTSALGAAVQARAL